MVILFVRSEKQVYSGSYINIINFNRKLLLLVDYTFRMCEKILYVIGCDCENGIII